MPSKYGFEMQEELRRGNWALVRFLREKGRQIDPIIRDILEDLKSAKKLLGISSVEGGPEEGTSSVEGGPEEGISSVQEGLKAGIYAIGWWTLRAAGMGGPFKVDVQLQSWRNYEGLFGYLLNISCNDLPGATQEKLESAIRQHTGIEEGLHLFPPAMGLAPPQTQPAAPEPPPSPSGAALEAPREPEQSPADPPASDAVATNGGLGGTLIRPGGAGAR
jgi:hypothetical protein